MAFERAKHVTRLIPRDAVALDRAEGKNTKCPGSDSFGELGRVQGCSPLDPGQSLVLPKFMPSNTRSFRTGKTVVV